jgi:hypothetical protein
LAKFDLNSYARRGAEARLTELTQELDSIYSAFPDLRSGRPGRGGRRAQATVTASPAAAPVARRRKGMSAAQKKAVSARMKKYWAERRKAKEK